MQDFLDTLKGATGDTGATGAAGANATAGALTIATEALFIPKLFFAPITVAQDINADVSDPITLSATTREDTGWSAIGAAGSFTIGAAYDHAIIDVSIFCRIVSP